MTNKKLITTEEIRKQTHTKLFIIDSFRYTISLLPNNNPDLILKHNVTVYFLNSIILELLIKILYEIDCKEEAPFTHNLSKIYEKLNIDTRDIFEKKYNKARKRKNQLFAKIPDNIKFHSLATVLANNEKIIKNFKYDAMAVSSNYSIDDIFYNEIIDYIKIKIKFEKRQVKNLE